MKQVYSAAKAREDFANIVNKVAFMGQSVVVERYGKPLVKITPVDESTPPTSTWQKTIDLSDLRVYSDREVDQFIKDDQLTETEREDAKTFFKNLS